MSISAMNGAIPVVGGHVAVTSPEWMSLPAKSASAPARSYSCSTFAGLPGRAGVPGWQRARAWIEGFASTGTTRSPGLSGFP